jgi:hypothetical protein
VGTPAWHMQWRQPERHCPASHLAARRRRHLRGACSDANLGDRAVTGHGQVRRPPHFDHVEGVASPTPGVAQLLAAAGAHESDHSALVHPRLQRLQALLRLHLQPPGCSTSARSAVRQGRKWSLALPSPQPACPQTAQAGSTTQQHRRARVQLLRTCLHVFKQQERHAPAWQLSPSRLQGVSTGCRAMSVHRAPSARGWVM